MGFSLGEAGPNGRRVNRKLLVGTKEQLPREADARRAIAALKLDINAYSIGTQKSMTVDELVDHYCEVELASGRKAASTRKVHRTFLNTYIRPRWGKSRLYEVRPVTVERWLGGLPHAAGTLAKIRNIMSAVFQHARRYGWAESNPITLVRQSAKRVEEPDILDALEVQNIIGELTGATRVMVQIASCTGLRVSEISGLQWQDLDFEKGVLLLRRGIVNQQLSELKTQGSKRPVPLPQGLVDALVEWRRKASFHSEGDWLFASPSSDGRLPYWSNTLLARHIRPAAARLGISKRIGWHSFRRSYATMLYNCAADVKVTQELMRHSTPSVTFGVYARAITQEKRDAQDHIAGLVLVPTGA